MKCKECVYYRKCREIPTEKDGCDDFKDGKMFVELPFLPNQNVYLIKNSSKLVPVVIDDTAYFRIESDMKVESHCISGDDLMAFLKQSVFLREIPEYFATREEAETALAERVKKDG